MKTVKILLTALMLIALAAAAYVYSGAYNVAADERHTRPVHALLETVRQRSIAARADELQPPADLNSPARITQGAGNYNAMCVGCHLMPGMAETELSRGLYPAPPDLTKATVDAAHAFWVIKHGIKATGMPAWGESMDDEYIWNMAAFLQELPKLDAAQYQALVASSEGHSHGGGESGGHAHAPGTPDDHHAPSGNDAPVPAEAANRSAPAGHTHGPDAAPHGYAAEDASSAASSTITHRHADGTVESHPAPASKKKSAPPAETADDGHDHHH